MFDLHRVRASWQRESAAVDAVIQELDQAAARQPIRDDGWTTQDLVGHIANAARAFVRQLHSDTALPAGMPFDLDALNERRRDRDRERPWSDVLAYWQQTRDEVTAFLEAAPADIGEQPARVPWVPQIETAGDALRALIIHTRSHRVELEQGWETMNDK